MFHIKTHKEHLPAYKIGLLVEKAIVEFLERKNYLKVDVPVLSSALIPESYLEVFETVFLYSQRKNNLYLTPSPELFLKRLLAYGVGNCFYLGKAFRNSEPSSDLHSPEFTMLEYYKIGSSYLQLADEVLEMMRYISKKINPPSGGQKSNPDFFNIWEKFTVAEAFEKFSKVRKDELFDGALFMKKAAKKGYNVKGFSYQDIFSQMISQEIEPYLGKNGHPTLLYDYPMEMCSLAKSNKDGKTAKRAEFYIHGIEIGGCCEELNDWVEQKERFADQLNARKNARMIDHSVDNGFIEALQYGLPNCTGVGIGFERLAMIFAGKSSIESLKLITVG